jgi:hypothetical protein
MVINAVVVRKRIAGQQYAYERTENPATEYKGAGQGQGGSADGFATPPMPPAYAGQEGQQGFQHGGSPYGQQWGSPYAGQNEHQQPQGYLEQTQHQQQGYKQQHGQVQQQGGYS